MLQQIVSAFRDANYQPPTTSELQKQATKNQAAVPQLVQLAANQGYLVKLNSEFYLHAEVEQELKRRLSEHLTNGGMTVSQIREILGTSRKYALPICEYLDRTGFTRREGDLRLLAVAPHTPA